eukprot:1148252-Pelagomonas_calceolata.AAC.2
MMRWANQHKGFLSLNTKVSICACDADEVIYKCPTADFVLGFLFKGLWAFVEALVFIASPASMEPA